MAYLAVVLFHSNFLFCDCAIASRPGGFDLDKGAERIADTDGKKSVTV